MSPPDTAKGQSRPTIDPSKPKQKQAPRRLAQVDLQDKGRPVVDATIDDNDVSLWCQYCQKHHHHGAGRFLRHVAPGEILGHWAPHCHDRTAPGNPYLRRGYILRRAEAAL